MKLSFAEPVSRGQRTWAFGILAVVVMGGLALLPLARTTLPRLSGFSPMLTAATWAVCAVTAILLFGRARATRERAILRLAETYCLPALALPVMIAWMPGVIWIAPPAAEGDVPTVMWEVWHAGFAALLLLLAVAPPTSEGRGHARLAVGAIAIAIALCTWLAVAGLWPGVMQGDDYSRLNSSLAGPAIIACDAAALAVLVWRQRMRTVLAVWVVVVLATEIVELVLCLTGGARYTVGWYAGRVATFISSFLMLSALLAETWQVHQSLAESHEKLAELAVTDALTGIPNRRRFDEMMAREYRRARREDGEVALLMIDVDEFKSFNDQHGHGFGDECLRRIADAVRGAVRRPGDIPARYGGEEFAVILPATGIAGAEAVAASIARAVRGLRIPHAALGAEASLSVSIGVSAARARREPGGETALLARADAALYQAKARGRDCVQVQTAAPEARAA